MGDALEMDSIIGALPAHPGLRVDITAPAGVEVGDAPGGGVVVGWALIEDGAEPGGARLDPVFLAAGRAWTPDQYRTAYGLQLGVQVKG